jgi:hypothetical protein
MSNLVDYLAQPLKKLFSSRDFKSAVKKYGSTPVSPVSYPFQFYPEAAITSTGAKFRYTDGIELISYHVKGIIPVGGDGNGFETYLCSVHFGQSQGAPFIFPGSITGMFMSGGGESIITTPLANGGLVELDGIHVPVSNLDINFYPYSNPQEDGSYIYALVIDATVENPDALSITGLVAYDFEFLLPSDVIAPVIFQD